MLKLLLTYQMSLPHDMNIKN